MTEDELLRAAGKRQSTSGPETATPAQLAPNDLVLLTGMPRSVEKSNGVVRVGVQNGAWSDEAVGPPITTQPPAASDGSLQKGPDQGMWREVWTFPFRALREFYWLLDPDAKCRSIGLQTVGRVDKKESEEHKDYETGRVSYTYHVSYGYQSDVGDHTDLKKVGTLGKLRKGASIRVYYLPDTYRPDSAIDWEPRTLAEQEVRSLEASPERAETGYAKITNGSESR